MATEGSWNKASRVPQTVPLQLCMLGSGKTKVDKGTALISEKDPKLWRVKGSGHGALQSLPTSLEVVGLA